MPLLPLRAKRPRPRTAATEALKGRPEAAVFVFRARRSATDPEVKLRLDELAPLMMGREAAEKRLAKLPDYAKNRQFDRLVETMVVCREFLTAEHDAPVRAFVKDAYHMATDGKEHKLTGEEISLYPFKTFAWRNRLGLGDPPTMVARTARPLGGPGAGVIASDLITGGDGMKLSIALCNGDVNVGKADGCIIIATGSVELLHSGSADAAVIISLGDVRLGGGGGSVIVTGGRLVVNDGRGTWEDTKRSIIREYATDYFAAWKLYSAAEAGATLRAGFGVVWVEAVAPGSAFAKAGVKPGDVIAGVDGLPVRTVREANRLLCRATVSWGATDLQLVCNGSSCGVIVALYDW